MELNIENTTSKDKTVTDIPTRNGPGLLDLPPEIRYIIFRLLLLHHDLSEICWYIPPRNYLAILKTNRLINRETSDVFYGENTFVKWFWSIAGRSQITWSPRIIDMMQNLQITLTIHGTDEEYNPFKKSAVKTFRKFVQDFGNQSIVRRTLAVTFLIDNFGLPLLSKFVHPLGQLTHFRTIELFFQHSTNLPRNIPNDITRHNYVQTALEPLFGDAEEFERDGFELKCLRFHPLDFSREQKLAG